MTAAQKFEAIRSTSQYRNAEKVRELYPNVLLLVKYTGRNGHTYSTTVSGADLDTEVFNRMARGQRITSVRTIDY